MQISLPNLSFLRYQLEEATPIERRRAAYYELELLPYSLGATVQAFFDFVQAESELLGQLPSDWRKITTIIGSGGRDNICYRIDSFLESARRTQNAVICYMSKALSLSLPRSLSEIVKKIELNKIELPSEIRADILGYWNNHGKKLKDYRDLGQHHALVASEVRIFNSDRNEPAIYLMLPNNPEVKNPTKLTFDDPPIQAFFYLEAQ